MVALLRSMENKCAVVPSDPNPRNRVSSQSSGSVEDTPHQTPQLNQIVWFGDLRFSATFISRWARGTAQTTKAGMRALGLAH